MNRPIIRRITNIILIGAAVILVIAAAGDDELMRWTGGFTLIVSAVVGPVVAFKKGEKWEWDLYWGRKTDVSPSHILVPREMFLIPIGFILGAKLLLWLGPLLGHGINFLDRLITGRL
jgi:hypothetical protein